MRKNLSPGRQISVSPKCLIEFDNCGFVNGQANHLHAIWREKGREFGEDVLKKNY